MKHQSWKKNAYLVRPTVSGNRGEDPVSQGSGIDTVAESVWVMISPQDFWVRSFLALKLTGSAAHSRSRCQIQHWFKMSVTENLLISSTQIQSSLWKGKKCICMELHKITDCKKSSTTNCKWIYYTSEWHLWVIGCPFIVYLNSTL